MSVRSYRDLKVWQRAMDLVPAVYKVVQRLPKEERYELGSQLRRAVVSVPANIAEGHARQSTKEYLHHLTIARGSLAELETLLLVAERLSYLRPEKLRSLESTIRDLRMPLQGLINSLASKLES